MRMERLGSGALALALVGCGHVGTFEKLPRSGYRVVDDDHGTIREVQLTAPAVVDGVELPVGSRLRFERGPRGGLSALKVERAFTFGGHAFPPGSTLFFHHIWGPVERDELVSVTLGGLDRFGPNTFGDDDTLSSFARGAPRAALLKGERVLGGKRYAPGYLVLLNGAGEVIGASSPREQAAARRRNERRRERCEATCGGQAGILRQDCVNRCLD